MIIAFLLICIFDSCKHKISELIVGKWTQSEIGTLTLTKEGKGTYIMGLELERFSYKINEDEKTFEMNTHNGERILYSINYLNADSLSLTTSSYTLNFKRVKN